MQQPLFFAPLRGCFLITAWKFNLSGPLGHLLYEERLATCERSSWDFRKRS